MTAKPRSTASVSASSWLAIVALALVFLSPWSPTAAEGAENKSVTAAATVLGSMEDSAAFLRVCRKVDSTNAKIYDGLALLLVVRDTAIADRIEKILREESIRSGQNFLVLYPGTKTLAQTAAEDMQLADPEKFLARCRYQQEGEKQQLGEFTPLEKLWPEQMRLINDWH